MSGTAFILILVAALAAGGLAYRKVLQNRTANSLSIDTPNCIVEEHFVDIGGIEQWIQIRGENRDNPILLILHGGPGWPNATFTAPLQSWEKYFTLVQWDHRGAGKTMRRNGKAGSGEMTFDRRVSDTIELIDFLRQYLCKDKVILLAESMGTLAGIPLAKRRPDLFSALVVTDLYVDMARNEALKYQMTLERLRAAGNTKAVAALEQIDPDPTLWTLRDWNINMDWAFKTNIPAPNLARTLLIPLVLSSPLYSLRDIFALFAGFQFSTVQMYEEIKSYNALGLGAHFEIPFFLFQGETDVITLTNLAETYFTEIDAPMKRMVLIKHAGHFAAFTQPDQFLAALLTYVRPLAVDENSK
jgi:pimeloyl-ACP methyl ester carboxylesterase